VECCRDGCPSGRLSLLLRGTLELCESDQGPFPPIAQFGRVASSGKGLGGYKLLPFKNDGGPSVL
jgi:hypothetical protein